MTQPASLPFGIDLATIFTSSGAGDLDAGMAEVGGRTLLAQRLLRRLTTRRGTAIDAPGDCLDVRDLMSNVTTIQGINLAQAAIQNEMVKDQGVQSSTTTVSYNIQTAAMVVQIQVQSGYGPFSLTLTVSSVTISVLMNGQPLGIA